MLHFTMQAPFNEAARKMAGFGPEWYLPLATEAATAKIAATAGTEAGAAAETAAAVVH